MLALGACLRQMPNSLECLGVQLERCGLIALCLQDSDFNVVHVDLANKPSWFPTDSTHELVPAVAYQDCHIMESIDICRHALMLEYLHALASVLA